MMNRDVDRVLVDWLAEHDLSRPNYLHEVLAVTARTRQRPAWSFPAHWLPKGVLGSPVARRLVLVLVAALLLALAMGAVGLVGSWVDDWRRDPVRDLSLERPADMAGFVRSAYDRMPDLEPMTLTALEDGATKSRIYVDQSGAIRIEEFASPEATEPETYAIFAGSRIGHLSLVESMPMWYEQDGFISEDPRVFVYARLGAASFGAGQAPGCETTVSPGETNLVPPASAWEYVGLEYVVGRPAHHFRCVGELWIDVDTRLTLRSRGAILGEDGRPIDGRVRTIEVTQIDFGQPDPTLFEIRRPDGVAVVSEEDYQCARSPYCSASPRPVITPPPAPAPQPIPVADLGLLIAAASGAVEGLPAFEAIVERSNTKYPGAHLRVLYDGSGRFRIEETNQPATVWESTTISLDGNDYRYFSEPQADGSTIWSDHSSRALENPYPLQPLATCEAGWEHRGVDVLIGRLADHVACVEAESESDFWVDRETHLVLRTQTIADARDGTTVQEVVDLRFVEYPAAQFELPEGAGLPR